MIAALGGYSKVPISWSRTEGHRYSGVRRGGFGVYLCGKSSENVRSNLKKQGFVVLTLIPSAGLLVGGMFVARRLCRG